MNLIMIGLCWTAAVCACWYFGRALIRQVPNDHCVFAKRTTRATREPAAGANHDLIEALVALGHKKTAAKRLAATVDPYLDVEIALQVIYSEYGKL